MENSFKSNHLSAFWGEHSTPNLTVFELVPHQMGDFLKAVPKITVVASMQGMSVCLSFFIERHADFSFDEFNPQAFDYQDFLWEKDCLECFFELNHQGDYFELNTAPSGAYNFYHFDNYRTPNTLPPRQDKHLSLSLFLPKIELTGYFERYFSVQFNHYFREFAHLGKPACRITKINPTAILYQDGKPIYYATRHANPPDFHDKKFWVDFSQFY